jgi:hypothetical protein
MTLPLVMDPSGGSSTATPKSATFIGAELSLLASRRL